MTTYATVHFQTLMVYSNGKLDNEVPIEQFPRLIELMARALQDRKPVDAAAPME